MPQKSGLSGSFLPPLKRTIRLNLINLKLPVEAGGARRYCFARLTYDTSPNFFLGSFLLASSPKATRNLGFVRSNNFARLLFSRFFELAAACRYDFQQYIFTCDAS